MKSQKQAQNLKSNLPMRETKPDQIGGGICNQKKEIRNYVRVTTQAKPENAVNVKLGMGRLQTLRFMVYS